MSATMNELTAGPAAADHTETEATVLIVDDEPANLALLTQVLQPFYRVRAARSGDKALRAAATAPVPDLILLDIMMPDMDGYTMLAELRKNAAGRAIPVLFVTALNDPKSEEHGLELGAMDYITKPINPAIVLARVRLHLELKRARDALAHQNVHLEAQVAARTADLKNALHAAETAHAELKKTYFSTLVSMNRFMNLRGDTLGDHSRRVADLARQVAQHMGLTPDEVQNVFVAALLHDIGMIGLPDDLLHIPINDMNREELSRYRRHPSAGAAVLSGIDQLAEISEVIRDHHEYYDGSGFPAGKSGLDIPLAARIICAVSDYDDLQHGRLTGQLLSGKQRLALLLQRRGSRYDPSVIDHLEPLIAQDIRHEVDETVVSTNHLQEGMLLTRDITHPEGYLLLSKSTIMKKSLIDQLVTVERQIGRPLQVFVARDPVT
jgi:putative two-component system response regulator